MASLAFARLTNRKIIRITGPDCYSYLQGLICNDLRHIYEPDRLPPRDHVRISPNVLSTFMLNTHGRVICDMIIYRTPNTNQNCQFHPPGQATEPDELYIECDAKLASGLANTLYGYRVRRKISLNIEEKLNVWSLFPRFEPIENGLIESEKQGKLVDLQVPEVDEFVGDSMLAVNDPRLSSLGLRILSKEGDPAKLVKTVHSIIDRNFDLVSENDYIIHRYKLGIGEGIRDHPESDCISLECNADFTGSVSFSKGCYLGQELTARIHHTGVIRKRLMPFEFDKSSSKNQTIPDLPGFEILDTSSGKRVGILRSYMKDRGLALLRLDVVSKSPGSLLIRDSKAKISAYKPYWWPNTT